MKNFIFFALAALSAVSCLEKADGPFPDTETSTATLSEVAEIMSRLSYEEEHLMEVYNAVASSSGNGYDEEYMMSDLFRSPGSGVGDRRLGTRAASYSRPIRELFAEYLSRSAVTRSGADGAEEYMDFLSASDVQIYWPYSEDWDGTTLPVITYDPGYGAETNLGYVLSYGENGAEVVDTVLVDEAMAMSRPVWVINRNDDAGFTPLEMFLKSSGADLALKPEPGQSLVGEEESRMLFIKSFQALRNYDSWFGGASEFFIKCGAVDGFKAATDAELKTYTPSVTDFMVVVKRRQVGKIIPLDALLLTKLESQQCIAEKRPYSLDEQIKRCAILLSPAWEKKRISFTANLEPAEYAGNEELMRHVWINLLNNAVKYTPEGGEITVTLQARPEELTEVFRLVNNYLDPGGVFIFDFNTDYKYREILGEQTIAEDRGDCSFIWDNCYYEDERINEYDLTLFIRDREASGGGELYRKYRETHYQRGYTLEEIKGLLRSSGLEFAAAYDAFTRSAPGEESERIYVVARESGKTDNR